TDLLFYYREHPIVSGIQRVMERLTASISFQRDPNVIFVVRARSTSAFFALDKTLLADLAMPAKRPATISSLKEIAHFLDNHRLYLKLKKYPWKAIKRRYWALNRRAARTTLSSYLGPFEFGSDDRVVLLGAYWIDKGIAQR